MERCWVCDKPVPSTSPFKVYCSYQCAGKMTKQSLGFRERNYTLRDKVDFDERLSEGFEILGDNYNEREEG